MARAFDEALHALGLSPTGESRKSRGRSRGSRLPEQAPQALVIEAREVPEPDEEHDDSLSTLEWIGRESELDHEPAEPSPPPTTPSPRHPLMPSSPGRPQKLATPSYPSETPLPIDPPTTPSAPLVAQPNPSHERTLRLSEIDAAAEHDDEWSASPTEVDVQPPDRERSLLILGVVGAVAAGFFLVGLLLLLLWISG